MRCTHGVRHKGEPGGPCPLAHAPPPQVLGAVMHFAPKILGKILLCTQCFSLKKNPMECMHSSVQCTLYNASMLLSTGYCSIHVYSQTHLNDLLVSHYIGNRQSTVQHLRSHIEQYGNNKCAVVPVAVPVNMKKK